MERSPLDETLRSVIELTVSETASTQRRLFESVIWSIVVCEGENVEAQYRPGFVVGRADVTKSSTLKHCWPGPQHS